jgi:hypothetical protein
MGLVAVMAAQNEKSSGISAQRFINQLAVACADAISTADITGPDPEGMRSKALDYVNHILGGVRFPRDGRAN